MSGGDVYVLLVNLGKPMTASTTEYGFQSQFMKGHAVSTWFTWNACFEDAPLRTQLQSMWTGHV